jgi:hypothetical protein
MTHPNPSPDRADVAILLATSQSTTADDAGFGLPAMLLPLQGRSFLQRAVEHLAHAGCRQLHVAVGDAAAPVRELLQDGGRWGCRISYHYLNADESLARFVRRLDLEPRRRYWLADATQLPVAPLTMIESTGEEVAAGRPLCWSDGSQPRWTGWGVFSREWLLACDEPAAGSQLDRRVLRDARLAARLEAQPLAAATLGELLASNRRLLADAAAASFAGRGSEIHPSAQIIAPVHIGAGVKVAAGAVIGPNVSIESGSFIDRGAHLSNSLVLPDTYVGEDLDLHGIITNGSLLANIPLNTVTEISDPNLLTGLPRQRLADLPGQRALARALRLALLPVHWLARWQTRHQREDSGLPTTIPFPYAGRTEPGRLLVAVTLPAAPSAREPRDWAAHFCRSFYPGLREVIAGRLQLVGPALRSHGEVSRLPPQWRRLYAANRCGLLNEALLQDMDASDFDDQFAGDVIACATQGDLRSTWKLLSLYLGRVLRNLRNTRPNPASNPIAAVPSGAAD